jgi:uncharacterized protein with LGFP repeats
MSTVVTLPLLVWPAAAAADDEVSSGETVVGELVQAWPEYEDPEDAAEGATEEPLTWIEPAVGEAVRVPTEQLAEDLTGGAAELPVGATVEVVVGAEVPDAVESAQGAEPAREVLAAEVVEAAPAEAPPVAAAAGVNHTVTVVMMAPAGTTPEPWTTLSEVVNLVNGPVRDFWSKETNGAVQLGTAATNVDWFQGTADCSDWMGLWDEAQARAGWTRGPGKHLLVYVPYEAYEYMDCSYGLGEIGTGLSSDGRMYVADLEASIIAHELGHNLSLGHSSGVQCDASVEAGTCETTVYADWYDVMGISWEQIGSLNPVQAADAGVLPSAQVNALDATQAGAAYTVHTLSPVSTRSGTRAVKLTDPDGGVYWLEYRTASGRDAYLGDWERNWPGLPTGVLLRRAAPSGDTSLLLDGTPSPIDDWMFDYDTTLPVGATVPISDGDFTVKVESRTATTAKVRVTPSAPSAITVAHQAAGGDGGALGAPTAAERCGLRDGGCFRSFQNGSFYWSAASGARVVSDGPIRSRWGTLGWESGRLGYPTADATCGLPNSGCSQAFQGGLLVGSASTPVSVVSGAIRTKWTAAGGAAGTLGYPTADERCGLVGGGCFQSFKNGSVYWTAATGAQIVTTGAIRTRWGTLGWEKGRLGYPTGDATCGLPDDGCSQTFQGGTLVGSAGTPVRVVGGAIRTKWNASGGAAGTLGYPTADERCGLANGGCFQSFKKGSVYWTAATGARIVTTGAIRARWGTLGWEKGALGYPTADPTCGLPDDGCSQTFQGGTLVGSAITPVRLLKGAIRTRWTASGGAAGTLGYPTADERCGMRNGGCFQPFQKGSVYWSSATGAHTVSGQIRTAWGLAGYERGTLGYPTEEPVAVGPDTRQKFQGGTLTFVAASNTVVRS